MTNLNSTSSLIIEPMQWKIIMSYEVAMIYASQNNVSDHCAPPSMRWQQIETVWRDYWRGCRLVDRLSACYGLDLAVNLTCNMLFFIVYAYFTLMSVYEWFAGGAERTGDSAAAFYWTTALACQLAGVSFRIVFISYRAEKIKQVV